MTTLVEKLKSQDVRKVEILMVKKCILSKMKKFSVDITLLSIVIELVSFLL